MTFILWISIAINLIFLGFAFHAFIRISSMRRQIGKAFENNLADILKAIGEEEIKK